MKRIMKELYGITVAMVTPFTGDDQVDLDGVAHLTNMLIDKGVNCLYPCGTTGEMLRLSMQERKTLAEVVIETAAGRVPVFVHCGAMNQKDTIDLVQHAKKVGADGAGIVTPVFFAQNERELEEYFVATAGCVEDFPVYLYNIPQCAANDLPVSVVERVKARCNNIVGIKYSYADINRTIDYININNGNFSVLHGCDRALLAMLAIGTKGTVSGVAGVFPEPFVACYQAWQAGDLEKARQFQKICVKFCDTLRCGSNMSYFKEGLKMRGISAGHMRKPQLDLLPEEIENLRIQLEKLCCEAGISLKIC